MTVKLTGKPLSSKAIEMMESTDKNKADTGENRGLRVSCGAFSIKTFFYRYISPVTNKLSQVKIGSFPQTSLAMARMKLQELKLIRSEGRCPASELKVEKKRLLEESQKPKATVRTVERLVELYLTERIEDRKFLHWLPGSAYTPTIENVLRLTLWTGYRTGEVCNMAWEDVDLEKGTIHLRETKTGVERYVHLSVQAINFLNILRLNSDKYLFPSQATKKPIQQKYLTENSWRLRQSGQMLDIPHWTPHDLRRTVRTGLSRLQCPNEVAEAVLGYTRGGVEGISNLYKYDVECREWLQVWADYLESIL